MKYLYGKYYKIKPKYVSESLKDNWETFEEFQVFNKLKGTVKNHKLIIRFLK